MTLSLMIYMGRKRDLVIIIVRERQIKVLKIISKIKRII
jgi:hypothetical protein